jgi:hypothetical protein
VVMSEDKSTIRRLIGPDTRSATETDARSLPDGYVELSRSRVSTYVLNVWGRGDRGP